MVLTPPPDPLRHPELSNHAHGFHTAPTLGVRRRDDPNTHPECSGGRLGSYQRRPRCGVAFLPGWDARLQQSSELLGVWSGTTSIGAPTRFHCRGALERRSGTPTSAVLRHLALSTATPAAGTRMGGTLPRPHAVLDQPQLPTLLRLEVSPVVQPQRMGSLSRLGGGNGGRPDPVLQLPGLDPHVLCAEGEGVPSRVHGCSTATGAQLHLSPFCLVQSCIEGLGLGEADVLSQTLRHQSPQEGVEHQGVPCSRGDFRVAASGSRAGHQQRRPPGSPPPCGGEKPATAGSGR
ncbi:unnamed protein product [Gadus morhua 'NCC']